LNATSLDARIVSAEAVLDTVDKKDAVKENDPQSADMAKVIGADRNLIAVLSQAIFAIAIEFGSGVGFWLVFGRTGPGWRVDVDPPSHSTELVADDPPQKFIPSSQSRYQILPIDEKPLSRAPGAQPPRPIACDVGGFPAVVR